MDSLGISWAFSKEQRNKEMIFRSTHKLINVAVLDFPAFFKLNIYHKLYYVAPVIPLV